MNDNPPIFESDLYTATVSEHINDAFVIATVHANDADITPAFNAVTYSIIGGNELGLFEVGPDGKISLTDGQTAQVGDYSLTVEASDQGGVHSDTTTVHITVIPNDIPTTTDASGQGSEDQSDPALIAVQLTGHDTDGSVVKFHITDVPNAGEGTLWADAAGTVAIAAGDYVDATSESATVYFKPAADWNGTSTFHFASVDNENAEDGTAATATVTVNAVNDPVTSDAPASASVQEDQSVAVTGLAIHDIDATLAPNGLYSVTLSASHGTLSLSTVTGLSFDAGDGTSDATMAFHGTLADINAALATASYAPDANYNGSDTISFSVSDNVNGTIATGTGSATGANKSIDVTVSAVNDAPTTDDTSGSGAEDNGAIAITLSGADAADAIDGGSVASFHIKDLPANGTLSLDPEGNDVILVDQLITATGNSATVYFTPAANFNGAASFHYAAVDNLGLEDATQATASITVSAVNDPVAANAPANAPVDEDQTLSIVGLSIADVDATLAPDGQYSVTLSATHGTLTLGTATGLSFAAGDGAADATMTFHGTLADINAALATASYAPDANYNGSAEIDFSVSDVVNGIIATGTGSPSSDSKIINVTVNAVNDPVTSDAPASASVQEDQSVAVTGLAIHDIDATLAPNGLYSVTLSASHGTLSLSTVTGLSFDAGDGTSDATMAFHGTLADINAALATASYAPDANYNGSDTISFSVSDNVNGTIATGTGSATGANKSIDVTVSAVNDAPTTDDTSGSGAEDNGAIAITLSGADAADAIDGGSVASFHIKDLPANGTLSLDPEGNDVILVDQLITATGNSATVYFTPAANFNGAASFHYAAVDNLGLEDATQATASITVSAVNDPPTISASVDHHLVEAGGVANGTAGVATATATLTVADVDSTPSYDTVALALDGWTNAGSGNWTKTGTYGTATLHTGSNTVTYALDDSLLATQQLNTTSHQTETFTIPVTDGQLPGSTNVVFTVDGSNDNPTISSSVDHHLVEAGGINNGNPGVATATATLTLADVDGTPSYDATGLLSAGWITNDGGQTYTHSADYGTVTLDTSTNQVTYALDNILAEGLTATSHPAQSFTVAITDNDGAPASTVVTFTVDGSNDGATIGGVATGSVTEDTNILLSLAAAQTYDAGASTNAGPNSVAIGDVNGDGIADIVTGDENTAGVSVLLGNGSGGFAAPVSYSAGAGASVTDGVALFDLDHDGKADIIATNRSSSTASVLLSTNGYAATQYGVGSFPQGVALGDVNGDGKTDIVTGNFFGGGSADVSILVGDGNGGFTTPASSIAGTGSTIDLALADFNGDGKLDIVTASLNSNSASVLLNTTASAGATPTFGAPATYSLGAGANVSTFSSLAAADLNGDGKADIVAASSGNNTVSVLLNTTVGVGGAATFASAVTYSAGSGNPAPSSVYLADMNGDGKADIVTADQGTNQISVLLNNGNGTFGTAATYSVGATGPLAVALADLNGDGQTDIVTANKTSNNTSVFLNNGGILKATGQLNIDAGQFDASTVAGSNNYGTFTLDAAGNWTYTASNSQEAIQHLGAGQTLTDSFIAYNVGHTASQLVTVTINGTNDTASITGTSTGSVAEDGTLTAGGTLTASDVDTGENHFATPASLSGSYGTFSFDPNTGVWGYSLNNAAANVQALTNGQIVHDQLTVTSADGTASRLIDVTITGANDTASISGTSTGSVKEDVAVSGGNLTTSGDLSASDADTGQSVFTAQAGTAGSNGYGTFTLNAAGHWTYTAGNGQTAIQRLHEGATLTDSFTAVSVDGSASRLVTVTITGTNDAPAFTSGATATVTEGISTATAAYTAAATDADLNTTLTYGFGGGLDDGLFSIDSATGAVTFLSSPVYGSPQDSGHNNVYDIIVTASDELTTTSKAVAITVNPLNTPPSVSNLGINETAISFIASDADNPPTLSLTSPFAGVFGNPALTTGATSTIVPTQQASAVTGTLQVTDGIASPINVIDLFLGTSGVNTFTAGSSNAALYGFGGNDILTGGTGNDTFIGGTGADTLTGNGGVNRFIVGVGDSPGTVNTGSGGSVSGYDVINDFNTATDVLDLAGPVVAASNTSGLANGNNSTLTIGGIVVSQHSITNGIITFFGPSGSGSPLLSLTSNANVAAAVQYLQNNDLGNAGVTVAFTATISGTAHTFIYEQVGNTQSAANDILVDLVGVTLTSGGTSLSTLISNGHVGANDAPMIDSNGGGASASISIAENTTAVTTVHATDPDLTTPTYSIVGGADSAKFTINASTGALAFIAAPNFEAPTDVGGDNVYNVTVRASDGTLTDDQAIAVTVTNVNEAPTITSGASASTPENVSTSTAVYTVTATDQDLGTTLTYSLTGTDAALFNIDAAGHVTFKNSPNFEAPTDNGGNNVYDIVVHANDGTNDTTKAVAITVTNVNEFAPVITSGTSATTAENVSTSTAVYTITATDADLTTPTYSITGTDAALFNVSAAGAVTFKTSPNFEAPADSGANNVYDIVVHASDGTNDTTQAVAITVTNVNEAPTITSGASASTPENVSTSTAVYTVTATDQDLGTTLTYSLTGTDAALFNIDAAGHVTFKNSPNFEAPTDNGGNNVYDIVVHANDGTNDTTKAVAITVTNVNEFAPVITSGTSATTAENVSTSTAVYTITATDADLTTPTYSITGTDAALFNVSAAGAVTFKTSPDFEVPADSGANNVYDIVVHANDGTNDTTQAVAITVTNVNDAPTATNDAIYVSGNTGGGAGTSGNVVIYVKDLLANDFDIDGSGLTITSVQGATANINNLTLNSNGTITFGTDNNTSTSDSFTYTLSDGAGGTATGTVTVSVDPTSDSNIDTFTIPNTVVASYYDGRGNNDTITGGSGNDFLVGSANNDSLNGGAGNDILQGGTGNDTLDGSTGTDLISFSDATSGVTFTLSQGTNGGGYFSTGALAGGLGTDQYRNIEGVIGSGSADTLTGSTGNDIIRGGGGNDVINGQGGVDLLDFSDGTTALNFTLVQSSSATSTGNLGNLGTDSYSNMEGVIGTNLNDTITGSSGNDILMGNGGNDVLNGGAGNDTLVGGFGSDSLTGGTGNDTFAFNVPGEGLDHIIDFNLGENDVISISAAGFGGGLVAGGDASTGGLFGSSAGSAFGSTSERFHYNTTTHTLFYDSNGSAAGGTIVELAVLENGSSLDGAHIKIV